MEAFKLPLPAVWIEPIWLVVQILQRWWWVRLVTTSRSGSSCKSC